MKEIKTVNELMAHLEELKHNLTGAKPAVDVTEEQKKAKAAYNSAFWEHMYSGIPANTLRDGGDTAKGFLVPDTYEDKLTETLRAANFLRSIGTVLNTTQDLHIPVVMKNGDAQWIGETERYCDVDIEFGEIVLGAHKLGTMTLLSEELLADFGIDLEEYIAQEYKERIAVSEEEAFLVGDGIGKPLGLVHQAEVGATTEQSGKISMDDMIDLVYSVKQAYRCPNSAVFVMSEDAYHELRKIRYFDGRYIWNPKFKDDGYDTLFGHRVFVSNYMSEIVPGSKPVLFGDFSYFWIGDRGKRNIKRLNEAYAKFGQVGFLLSERVDSKLVLKDAIKALKVAE